MQTVESGTAHEQFELHGLAATGRTGTVAWRLHAVLATAGLDRATEIAWCRTRGLDPQELSAWRCNVTHALTDPSAVTATTQPAKRRRGHVGMRARKLCHRDKTSSRKAGRLESLLAMKGGPARHSIVAIEKLRQLAQVAQLTTNAVMITDVNRRMTWVNPAFTAITGYSLAEAYGRRPSRLLQGEQLDNFTLQRIRRTLDKGQAIRTSFLNRRKSGRELWLDLDIQPLHDRHARLSGFAYVATDITERKQVQADLRISALAFDSLEAIVITDAQQRILKVNAAFTRITGYDAAEAVGQRTSDLLRSGRQDAAFYARMWSTLTKQHYWQGELWNRRKNGESYPEWLSITGIADDNGCVTNYVAVFADITHKKQAEEVIHRLSFYDPLTGLPNRRLLHDRLQQAVSAVARGQQMAAVLFIDIDRFKAVNDAYGHHAGDALLVEVARRLTSTVRASDTVARQGGDEFVVILPDLVPNLKLAAQQAHRVAEKIRVALSQPFALGEFTEHHISASIGISLCDDLQLKVDELLKRADSALYEAKRAGRNIVRFFDPEAHVAIEQRMRLLIDLGQALVGRQFVLYFQMQVDHESHIIGAEALLRWHHPQRGLLLPGEFVPLAEETDLILQMANGC